jgi:hypothetical protein
MRGTRALFQRFSQPLHDELDIPGLKLSPAFDFGLITILWVFFEILFGELSREWLFFGELLSDEEIFHRRMKARLRRRDNPGVLRYRSYDFVQAKVTSCRLLLRKIIKAAATSASRWITLTVQGAALLPPSDRTGLTMLTAMAAVFIVLSVGILIAHALDAFRSR